MIKSKIYKTLKYNEIQYYSCIDISNENSIIIQIFEDKEMTKSFIIGTFKGDTIKEQVENALFRGLKYKIIDKKIQKDLKEFKEWNGEVVPDDRVMMVEWKI